MSETDPCRAQCDHRSACMLPRDHRPSDRHETEHGCIFYDERTRDQAYSTGFADGALWGAGHPEDAIRRALDRGGLSAVRALGVQSAHGRLRAAARLVLDTGGAWLGDMTEQAAESSDANAFMSAMEEMCTILGDTSTEEP